MAYQPTQIRKPEDETEFEKNVGMLFRVLLSDPNVQRLGRRGQKQYGIDLVGHRNCDAQQVVGIQCKLKGEGKKLSETEVKTEVRKALTYKPALKEYFIVTTAPNDGRLTSLAQTLSKRQASKGRKILIEVWGWNTLSERINEHESVKEAFDPGFSPSIRRQREQLDQIISGQAKLATSEQVAGIAAKLGERATGDVTKLPNNYADREVRGVLSRALRRRGFMEANIVGELGELAERVISGDLSLASASLRLDVIQRAARAHVGPNTLVKALSFFGEAKRLDPTINSAFFDALIDDANGKTDDALRALRQIDGPDTRSAIFNIIANRKGTKEALDWFVTGGYKISDFNAQGAVNLLLKLIENGQLEDALSKAESVPIQFAEQAPALYLVRANLKLASALPLDHRRQIFVGLPINPRMLRLASDQVSRQKIKSALTDIHTLLPIVRELKLVKVGEYLEELALWVQLEDSDTAEVARQTILAELADPAKTLRRLRLALFYDIPFNRDALSRHLRAQKGAGGWTDDEQFAAFLLAFRGESVSILASFFDEYRDELFANKVLTEDSLAGIEVEALARAGRFDDAKRRLEEHRAAQRLSAEQVDAINPMFAAIEAGDEAEQIRQRYEKSKSLQDLFVLIEALNVKNDQRQLAIYAPILTRATRRVEDFGLALSALFSERRYDDLFSLTDELPELFSLNLQFSAFKAWSLFHVGRVMEARSIARALLGKRNDPNDRELAINTAIESGDWGYLQSILTSEVTRTESIEPLGLMRLARLAMEVGSPYVDQFRDAALRRAPDDPQVNLAAYMLSVERGDEYQESAAPQWLERAARLSGPEGPVQQIGMRELIDQAPGWNRHVAEVDRLLRQAQMPLFLAAHALRRQPMEFIYGQAIRNEAYSDPRHQSPVLAFSGSRPAVDFGEVQRVALDLTTIFTLENLGILQKAIGAFAHVMIAPTTLSSLFIERQFLHVRQPSEQAKAGRISNHISSGLLHILPEDAAATSQPDIDDDLARMLNRARQEGALVIRSAPVFKRGSFLEEEADLSAFSDVLADTYSVLSFLIGKIDAAIEAKARAYLNQVDRRWPASPPISASSILYLDDLTVTYLDHVRLLEPLTRSVQAIYVSVSVQDHAKAVIRSADQSEDLLKAVEHIRATLNAALEKGEVHFTHRRVRGAEELKDNEDDGSSLPPMPALDILSNLAGIDVVACDDRFLNKDITWSDPGRRVPTACTLDLLRCLLARQAITSEEYHLARHILKACGYYAVTLEANELLGQLDRAKSANGLVAETPELRAIRENISIGSRAGVFLEAEAQWLLAVRFAIVQAIRDLWSRPIDVAQIIPKVDWLLAVLPDPMVWCANPADENKWALACQQAAAQNALLLCFFTDDASRRTQYWDWIEKMLIQPMEYNRSWLWEGTMNFLKMYLQRMLEIPDEQ